MASCDRALLRRLRSDDVPAAYRLSAEAGWNQTEDDWRLLLDLAPDGCLALEMNGYLAATTTQICYGRKLSWIGMVLTSREYRRQGLARTLLGSCLDWADQKEIETIKLDATDQGQGLYETFGFQVEQEVQRWSRPGEHFAKLPTSKTSVEEPWRNSDFKVFGADRSLLLQRLAQHCSPISASQSYLFFRPGRTTAYLGPCVGENRETARQLIEQCVQGSNCSWSWDLFPENKEAVVIAQDLGFSPQRHLVRMRRGKQLREKTNSIFAIAGFEIG
jgi:GNAT superfamily N-acetyltransferase